MTEPSLEQQLSASLTEQARLRDERDAAMLSRQGAEASRNILENEVSELRQRIARQAITIGNKRDAWFAEHQRAEQAEAALLTYREQITPYVQHTADCELAISHCTPRDHPTRFRWVWWKSVIDGLIWEKPAHVCGLSGFGAIGDVCDGCNGEAVSREPVCTCGLSVLLVGAGSGEQEPPS